MSRPYRGSNLWPSTSSLDGAGILVDANATNLSTLEGFTHGASSGDVNGDGSFTSQDLGL